MDKCPWCGEGSHPNNPEYVWGCGSHHQGNGRKAWQSERCRVGQLEARLKVIDDAAYADAEDLAKMRDGTKMTRAGLVGAIVYLQQDVDELKQKLQSFAEAERLIRFGHISISGSRFCVRDPSTGFFLRKQMLPNDAADTWDTLDGALQAYKKELATTHQRERCPEACKHVYRMALEQSTLVGDEPRCSGLVVCEICNRELYDHPQHPHEPCMTVTCDGRVVKL